MKKHAKDLSDFEKDALMRHIRGDFKFTDYCLWKMERRKVTRDQVLRALNNGDLIEYHFHRNTNRVLIRGREKIGGRQLCVVVQVKTREIITVYWNNGDDHHETIDWSAYSRKVNILEKLRNYT